MRTLPAALGGSGTASTAAWLRASPSASAVSMNSASWPCPRSCVRQRPTSTVHVGNRSSVLAPAKLGLCQGVLHLPRQQGTSDL